MATMSLPQWITSIFQPQRPTSCHLHLLNESQALHSLQLLNPIELIEPRPIGEPSLDLLFHENISVLGGKENILLVGESGYSTENNDKNQEMLRDLSFALFGTPRKYPEDHEGPRATHTCGTSKSLSTSRMIDYPVILAVFRDTLLMDVASKTLVKEVLNDVKVRTKESRSAVVGIVLAREPCEKGITMGPKDHLAQLMSRIFKMQPWGVCCYFSLQPNSIHEVKWTIIKTLGGSLKGEDSYSEYQNYDLAGSFRDLVSSLGGKERFLFLGNICPSTSSSQKVGVFKEITRALFDDIDDPCKVDGQQSLFGQQTMTSKECVRLPTPRSFPYPLILVVFRSSFLKEDANKTQVKEILLDIKTRVKMPSTQVVGVLCCQEPLGEAEQLELQVVLQKILCQVFNCITAVCTFVRTRPETVDQVKRCVCGILKQTT